MAKPFTSRWIGHSYDPTQDLGVYAFALHPNLDSVPDSLLVKLSADNRYKLYVNGELAAFGPQRGDVRHWFYDVVDLAPFLVPGKNEVLALVWNFGYWAPMAQHTVRTGFFLESEAEGWNTPGDWHVARLEGWTFQMMHRDMDGFYIDVGPGEIVDLARVPERIGEANLDWRKPYSISHVEFRGQNGGGTPWNVIPRSIPAMVYSKRLHPPARRYGFQGDRSGGPDRSPLQLPMAVEGPVLLDYGELLCAYPRLRISGPAGTTLTLTYAEALWGEVGDDHPAKNWGVKELKGNRNDVSGKRMRGYQDKVVLGGKPATFEPLWWRTFRYVLLEADGPVQIEKIDAYETGYPLIEESSFKTDDPRLDRIWEVAVRTAARCAGETYFDCPYYEQLQYVGDTRIQALIGYYLSTDRQLQRNAIETIRWSLMENGLTYSRYPSRQPQVIPPFSLWWVLMRHDQRMYDRVWSPDPDDDDPIDTVGLDVANAFNRLSGEDLTETFWNFGDWVRGWEGGVPPGGVRSTMHMLTLYLAHLATEIGLEIGGPKADARRKAIAAFMVPQFEFVNGLVKHKHDPDWQPSEHNEALWRLLQERLGLPVSPWPARELRAQRAAKTTYYFSYYKHLAMRPEDYLAELGPWFEMIEEGLTTFAEHADPVRSDCHAWSAHPILGFFQVVAGVTSSAHGWRRARIAPNPGSLRRFDARIAHPDGELRVTLEDGSLTVDSPVPYDLVWKGKTASVPAGRTVY
jgi:hypothetical protein